MTENDPQLPEKIRKALKESLELVPPESFYRGVLKEIERQRAPAEEKTPWYWGYRAKGLATASVLFVMVLITREPRKSPPEPSAPMSSEADKRSAVQNGPVAASAPALDDLKALAKTKEVQDRLQSPISNLVGTPSPFEEVDEETKRSLVERRRDAVALAQLSGRASPEAASGMSPLSMSHMPQEWKGLYSGVSSFKTVVIRTLDDWQKLWRDHNGYIVPPPPLPSVDFANFMVIGVFDGAQPSGGHSVVITDVQTMQDAMEVMYIETRPAANAPTTQALTEPFDLRVVPTSTLPIRFKKLKP